MASDVLPPPEALKNFKAIKRTPAQATPATPSLLLPWPLPTNSTKRPMVMKNKLPGKPSVPFFQATVAGFRGKVDGN